jgi:hypothetical protein
MTCKPYGLADRASLASLTNLDFLESCIDGFIDQVKGFDGVYACAG